ncbi:MAG: polyprenyl synthetase family protein [Clostridia bacterium]|nr:polyprenyl synthetase family protein [Clostridia bacterium]
MNRQEYDRKYSEKLDIFLKYSENVFSGLNSESKICEAMKYSFFAGGKRIRPVLMLCFSDIIGGNDEKVLPFAFALECIHTYSLIHDDLPALDNDDLRRGRPSCHIVYKESGAILAGDALLNLAFEHLLKNCNSKKDVKAAYLIADHAGFSGMLGGQALDIESENGVDFDENKLLSIYEKKTGKFLKLPFTVPATLFNEEFLGVSEEYGNYFGLLFQFVDDLLDVKGNPDIIGKSTGKDEEANKLTSIKIYGINGVYDRINYLKNKLIDCAKRLDDSGFLNCLVDSVVERI